MLSVTNKHLLLSVVMLSVIKLGAMAPLLAKQLITTLQKIPAGETAIYLFAFEQ
jgi:hypothetical protein